MKSFSVFSQNNDKTREGKVCGLFVRLSRSLLTSRAHRRCALSQNRRFLKLADLFFQSGRVEEKESHAPAAALLQHLHSEQHAGASVPGSPLASAGHAASALARFFSKSFSQVFFAMSQQNRNSL